MKGDVMNIKPKTNRYNNNNSLIITIEVPRVSRSAGDIKKSLKIHRSDLAKCKKGDNWTREHARSGIKEDLKDLAELEQQINNPLTIGEVELQMVC